MRDANDAIGIVNLVAFAALALVAVAQWWTRRDRAAAWLAAAFAVVGLVAIVGRLLPEHPRGFGEEALQRVLIAALLLFPFLLYRFTAALGGPVRHWNVILTALTATLLAWTFALPRVPTAGEARPGWFVGYLVAFVAHWAVLSLVVAWRLHGAGRNRPSVTRRRMRILASAAAAITVAIVLLVLASERDSPLALAASFVATASSLLFFLGIAPPSIVRFMWRRPEQAQLQEAISGLMMLATRPEQVIERVLGPMTDIVGARGIAVRDAEGAVVGAHNVTAAEIEATAGDADSAVVDLAVSGGSILVWTTPYAPFFGNEEFRLLRSLGALTMLALDRARLFAREREARLALERADGLKTTFVALAAHELRTPITTIHGFVQTLNHLADRLTPEREAELRAQLEGQTARMASLVEQLLDLSRLDADALEIQPETIRVRERVEQVVAASGAREIEVDVPSELEVTLDANVFERVLSNLVTNAVRYGRPPVFVRAEQRDVDFHLAVEDRGAGVPPEFVPSLFERFARSDESRRLVAGGTGLGLAIARAYAHAHGGELRYERASPTGARFELVVPVRR